MASARVYALLLVQYTGVYFVGDIVVDFASEETCMKDVERDYDRGLR